MTLTSEMSRITTEFEAAQGERLAAVAKIATGVARDKHGNQASLKRTMSAHRAAAKTSLRDIFGAAALARGGAEDMIERLRSEREECASALRDQLNSYVADLRETVGEELAHLTATRVKMARREERARRAALKDLRRRVEALLAGSVKMIEDFNKDRQCAGRIWGRHLRNAPLQRRTATKTAEKHAAAPRKRSVRRTAKKRKRTPV